MDRHMFEAGTLLRKQHHRTGEYSALCWRLAPMCRWLLILPFSLLAVTVAQDVARVSVRPGGHVRVGYGALLQIGGEQLPLSPPPTPTVSSQPPPGPPTPMPSSPPMLPPAVPQPYPPPSAPVYFDGSLWEVYAERVMSCNGNFGTWYSTPTSSSLTLTQCLQAGITNSWKFVGYQPGSTGAGGTLNDYSADGGGSCKSYPGIIQCTLGSVLGFPSASCDGTYGSCRDHSTFYLFKYIGS